LTSKKEKEIDGEIIADASATTSTICEIENSIIDC
jgi:hypothetical protein